MGLPRRLAAVAALALLAPAASPLTAESEQLLSEFFDPDVEIVGDIRLLGIYPFGAGASMAPKIVRKAKAEPNSPPGPSLLAGDPDVVRYTATGAGGKLVVHTTEASRGDVQAQWEVGWPANGGPYGEGFLQFNFHGPDGVQVAEVGVQAYPVTSGPGGVTMVGVVRYSSLFETSQVNVPVTVESGGSSLLLRGTLAGQGLVFEVADGAGGGWTQVLSLPALLDGEDPQGHTIEFGFVAGLPGSVMLTRGGGSSGVTREVTAPALAQVIGGMDQAFLAFLALDEGNTESGAFRLGNAIGNVDAAVGLLEAIPESSLERAALSPKTVKAAVKALAGGRKLLAKAEEKAQAAVADPGSADKGLRKVAEAGAALKGLSKKIVKAVLTD